MIRDIVGMSLAAAVGLLSGHVPVCHSGAPYPDSTLIAGLSLDWSTHRRGAQGSDNFQLTWADNDSFNTVCGTFIIREDSKGKD